MPGAADTRATSGGLEHDADLHQVPHLPYRDAVDG